MSSRRDTWLHIKAQAGSGRPQFLFTRTYCTEPLLTSDPTLFIPSHGHSCCSHCPLFPYVLLPHHSCQVYYSAPAVLPGLADSPGHVQSASLSLLWTLPDASGCTLPHVTIKTFSPSPQQHPGAIMSSCSFNAFCSLPYLFVYKVFSCKNSHNMEETAFRMLEIFQEQI